MKIAQFYTQPYQVRLRTPFRSARKSYAARSGYFVWLYNSGGIYGIGEAAPLPGFSEESVRDVEQNLREIAPAVQEASLDITENAMNPLHLARDVYLPPSVRFALDSAALDLLARSQNISLHKLLAELQPSSVRVNGLIDLNGAEFCEERANELVAAGFSTIKMKVGRKDFDADVRCVEMVRRAVQNKIYLRLDANQAWNVQEAEVRLNRLEIYDIEYIEQPIPRGNPEGLLALKSQTSIPIAVDEDVYPYPRAVKIIEEQAADALILKPAILGGYRQLHSLIMMAGERDMKIILSSALESPVARSAILQLAGAFAPENTHGLAPASYPDETLFPTWPYHPSQGEIVLPQTAGIGVDFQPEVIGEV
ncbi:MAG TPA: o-succinylbenzoate synthase [bacterium]|nr:o-succinylbenzoate synthase [bacterium]